MPAGGPRPLVTPRLPAARGRQTPEPAGAQRMYHALLRQATKADTNPHASLLIANRTSSRAAAAFTSHQLHGWRLGRGRF